MRTNIIHPGADELTYEIRQIVDVANKLKGMGVNILWENIGDPVAKGNHVPAWVKEIILDIIEKDDSSFGYSPTKGLVATREFLANQRNAEGGVEITPDDILFFNGLGDAISITYTYLNKSARVIGPNPAYSTHSSAEGAHAGEHHLTYNLNPHRNWLPDLDDLRNKVKYNPNIAGILIINPDNPTGLVYPEKILREIVAIAREYDLFIISDEIYANIVYGEEKMTTLSKVLGDVPGIAMKGLSKEIPWPGSRCGWIEFYNKDKDPMFARYAKTLVDAKQLEVCATTLPQRVIPELFSDPRYAKQLADNARRYQKRAERAYDAFRHVSGVTAPKPGGGFYLSVVFDGGLLNGQSLPLADEKVRTYIEEVTTGVAPDKKFVYYLMAKTGICVVPLSGFNSDLEGFRMTLLEPDDAIFEKTLSTLAGAIKDYLSP